LTTCQYHSIMDIKAAGLYSLYSPSSLSLLISPFKVKRKEKRKATSFYYLPL